VRYYFLRAVLQMNLKKILIKTLPTYVWREKLTISAYVNNYVAVPYYLFLAVSQMNLHEKILIKTFHKYVQKRKFFLSTGKAII
jgi:hypothetical protein